MAGSPPNLHTMVPSVARMQGVLKVKVKGHAIRTVLCFHENRFFSHSNGWISTKVAQCTWSLSTVCSRSRSKVTWYGHFCDVTACFAIQYLLTFCLYMHSLYEAPLHSPSSISVKQLDVMSRSKSDPWLWFFGQPWHHLAGLPLPGSVNQYRVKPVSRPSVSSSSNVSIRWTWMFEMFNCKCSLLSVWPDLAHLHMSGSRRRV